MSSFLAQPPSPSTVTVPPQEPVVTNDGWFPDVSPAELRASSRLNGNITPDRLAISLAVAMSSVNDELATYKADRLAEGHNTLAVVPAAQIGGQSIKATLYLRAVYSLVQADVLDRYPDFGTTAAGEKRAEELPTSDALRRDARWAISDILGRSRSTVELI